MHSSLLQTDTAPTGSPAPHGRSRRFLLGLDRERLAAWAGELGEPAYRGGQMFRWIHARRARSFDEMTDLPLALRETLAAGATLARPRRIERRSAADGTTRWVLALADDAHIEAVHIPTSDRDTLCVSSQVGCRFACTFCATGTMGLARHLDGAEIVAQVMVLVEEHGLGETRPFNVVYMGMGEPLDNLDAVLDAFHVLTDPDGFGLSWQRLTVSTVGHVPGIRRLARESRRPRLAISLSGTSDAVRDRLVPANRKWPLAMLRKAVAEYPVRGREQITFEYVVLAGENDTDGDITRLAEIVRNLPVRVNLIPWNEHPDLQHTRPSDAGLEAFRDALRGRGVDVTIRFSRGRDIGAACGQLITSLSTAERSAAR